MAFGSASRRARNRASLARIVFESSASRRAATFVGYNTVPTHLGARLGPALRLRVAPEIEFRNDESIAHAAHIEQLLAQVRRDLPPEGDAPAAAPASDQPPAGEGHDD